MGGIVVQLMGKEWPFVAAALDNLASGIVGAADETDVLAIVLFAAPHRSGTIVEFVVLAEMVEPLFAAADADERMSGPVAVVVPTFVHVAGLLVVFGARLVGVVALFHPVWLSTRRDVCDPFPLLNCSNVGENQCRLFGLVHLDWLAFAAAKLPFLVCFK